MSSSVTARGVFSVELCPSEGQTVRGYQALWSRNDGREPPGYCLLTKVSPPSQDEVGNKWWKVFPDGGSVGFKDSGESWNLLFCWGELDWPWVNVVSESPGPWGCSRRPLEELSSCTRPRARAQSWSVHRIERALSWEDQGKREPVGRDDAKWAWRQPVLHAMALGSASGKPGLESAEMSMETQTSTGRWAISQQHHLASFTRTIPLMAFLDVPLVQDAH